MSGGAIKLTWKVEGFSELAAVLEDLSERITRKLLREGLIEAAEPMRARMSERAPRRTGRLKEDMTVSPARGADADEVAVAVGPSAEAFYGGLVEYGTAHRGARPFARPAFDEESDAALDILAAAVWRELAARGVSRTGSAPSTPSAPGGGGLL